MWHAKYRKHIERQTGVSKIYFNPTVVLQMAVKMLYTTRAPQYLKYCCKYVKPLPYIPTRWRCMRRCCSCALTMSPPPTCTSTMPDLWASGSLAFPLCRWLPSQLCSIPRDSRLSWDPPSTIRIHRSTRAPKSADTWHPSSFLPTLITILEPNSSRNFNSSELTILVNELLFQMDKWNKTQIKQMKEIGLCS